MRIPNPTSSSPRKSVPGFRRGARLLWILVPWMLLPSCGGDDDGGEPRVVINEFTSSNEDVIEIYNAGSREIDLSGWILTDDPALLTGDGYDPDVDDEKYVFPAGLVLKAGRFLILPKGSGDRLHPFGIAAGGETLTLVGPDGVVRDQVTYGEDQAQSSYCRQPDGGEVWQSCAATFGSPNQ